MTAQDAIEASSPPSAATRPIERRTETAEAVELSDAGAPGLSPARSLAIATPRVSVVIPGLNEADSLRELAGALSRPAPPRLLAGRDWSEEGRR